MKFAKRAQTIEHSLTRELFDKAKNYDNVIDLTLGDPDILPSEKIRKAACDAVIKGQTRYSANAGLPELREAICRCMKKEYQVSFEPNSEVIVTVGGMEALYLSLACILDEGDEVIIQAPYYVNYVQMVRMCGGVPVIINTAEESGFAFTEEQLKNAITDRTAAIIINSPCNPTGVVLGAEILDKIAEIARQNNLFVISDEVYRTLLYDGCRYESIITRPGMKDHTILIDSFSKRFAMTGYRVGYAAASADMVANMAKMQENVAACAPLPSQYAAIAAYNECVEDSFVYETFAKRHEYMVQAINSIEGLYCRRPEGAFYLFVNISSTSLDCVEFAYKLLEAEQVAVVPGISYGSEYHNYIRIAYTRDLEQLKAAAARITRFMESLK